MDRTIIPVATALIPTLGAFVSVVFARRSARGNRLETADQVAMKFASHSCRRHSTSRRGFTTP